MNQIADFAASSAGFFRKTAVEQLLLLAWHSETQLGRRTFDAAFMRQCFKDAGLEPPDMSIYLGRLIAKKPPQLIREKEGYRLVGTVRRELDKRLGGDPTVAAVTKALHDLPKTLPDIAEREYLTEAINCYRVKAYRAAIIMTWNLTYDHLLDWIFSDNDRISALNAGISTKYPKKSLICTTREDSESLKESELIESARTGHILDKNTTQILKDKLNRRNMAAHPSRVLISQHQADDMITDLISNVLLKLI